VIIFGHKFIRQILMDGPYLSPRPLNCLYGLLVGVEGDTLGV